jgi:hypothetical protein
LEVWPTEGDVTTLSAASSPPIRLTGFSAFAASADHIVTAGRRATSRHALARSPAAALPAHGQAVVTLNLCITTRPAGPDDALSTVATSRTAVAPSNRGVPTTAAIFAGTVFLYWHRKFHLDLSMICTFAATI